MGNPDRDRPDPSRQRANYEAAPATFRPAGERACACLHVSGLARVHVTLVSRCANGRKLSAEGGRSLGANQEEEVRQVFASSC